VIGFGVLEWTFLAVLVVLVGAPGVFALFLLVSAVPDALSALVRVSTKSLIAF
jgi:hypothetical protein